MGTGSSCMAEPSAIQAQPQPQVPSRPEFELQVLLTFFLLALPVERFREPVFSLFSPLHCPFWYVEMEDCRSAECPEPLLHEHLHPFLCKPKSKEGKMLYQCSCHNTFNTPVTLGLNCCATFHSHGLQRLEFHLEPWLGD